jgi:hypothetical protein
MRVTVFSKATFPTHIKNHTQYFSLTFKLTLYSMWNKEMVRVAYDAP